MFPELHGSLNELEPEASAFSGKAPGEAEAQTPVLPRNRSGGPRWPPPPCASLLPWSCSHTPVFAQSWKPAAGVFQTMLCSSLPGYWGVDQRRLRQGEEGGVSGGAARHSILEEAPPIRCGQRGVFSSVQSLSRVRLFATPMHTMLPCPSPTPRACSNSGPSSR